ncbi:bifunctional diguanylate cyclase/phosphodiesterase [Frankia sp. Cj3]|uniref:putative bifunctional diguanylate cyclase/phosphodiesterase n=1 Tax=Frankia sp. Cj3 TaxID=2880976 RepID=UPI001EF5FDFE|nr:EAL domain-containing protein [Frankia sp. Cj3]
MRPLHPAVRQRGVERFALAWARELVDASCLTINVVEVEQRLRVLTGRLVDALLAETFVTAPAVIIGAAIIEYRFGAGDALACSIRAVGNRLLDDLELDAADGYAARLVALQAGLADGYTQALREQILAAQDSIHQAALYASDARFRLVFAGSAIGIAISDADGSVIEANGALLELLGVGPAQIHGRRIDEFAHPEDAGEVRAAYGHQRGAGPERIRLEKRFTGAGGAVVWADLTISCLRDDDGRCRVQLSMVVDITERHRLQTQLRSQAFHDPLTGLPNRALLLERLSDLMVAGSDDRVGVCFIDLDGFKTVNDSLGHDVGDRLLVALADRLSSTLPPTHLFARMGGDEFVVVVAGSTGSADVIAVAEQVLAELARPLQVDGHLLSVSASIGVVERPVADGDPRDLLRAADITLYRAKSDGKGRWALFDAERNAHEITRHTLATMLPGAFEQDQFILEYQPIVALADDSMAGVEALVRWRHPRFGLLSPGLFVDIAEETGLIVPLGGRLLYLACLQARSWQDLSPARPFVSVNLAARQTRDPQLVEQVQRVLGDTGLSPDRLQLELTESAFMGTADEPLRALRALADMGVRIAIDDFGTGYSNLAYLRRLPVHTLKLAGPFVEGLRSRQKADPDDEKIVQAMVGLAHSLRLTVTAEGVETTTQAERLRAVDCDTAQGYLFARPLPPEEITHRLTRRYQERTSPNRCAPERPRWELACDNTQTIR